MTNSTELTVDELRALLDQASAAGHGNDKVVIPYKSSGGSIGARPSVGVTDCSGGIDWDSGKMFLAPSKEMGVPDAQLFATAQKAQRDLGRIQFLAGRLGSERGGPLEDQVAQFQAALDALTTPTQPKKMTP